MDQVENINTVIKEKNLTSAEAKIAKECMIKLCQVCDTKKNLASLNDLFYNLSDGIILFDLDLNLIDANKYGKSFLAEHEIFKYQDKEYKLKELPIIQDREKIKKEKTIEVRSFNKNNTLKAFNISCSFTFSAVSEPVGICMVVNDVTEIEKQVQQLEDMMSSFTHDLKTPLIALETNIKHILNGEYGDCNENLRKILALMLLSSSNTLKLVKNLLSVFKYDARSYKLLVREIKAAELVNNAIRALEPQINDKQLKISIDLKSNYLIYCDSFEIERVLTNLLSNAVKFSPKRADIEIIVTEQEGYFVFQVKDRGIGIPKENLKSLFTRFWQAKTYNADASGTGLGLYLSRQIIEAHSGTIWVDSEVKEGTTISFKIPNKRNLIEQKDMQHD